MNGQDSITWSEIIRITWPILVVLAGVIWAEGGIYFMVRQNKEDIKSLAASAKEEIAKANSDLSSFKTKEYVEDRHEIFKAIEKLEKTHKDSEKKLEDKLDKMASVTDQKLDKLTDGQNQTNLLLAELKGRSYPKLQASVDV